MKYAEEESLTLSGEMEVDESYFGGHRKGNRGRGTGGKIAVIGAISRNGKVQARVIEQVNAKTLNSFICNTMSKDSVVFTDGFKGYNKITKYGYKHNKVNHSKTFVKAKNVHTNTIESFRIVL